MAAGCSLLVSGLLLAARFWFLAFGYWSLAACFSLSASSKEPVAELNLKSHFSDREVGFLFC
jgi:hypothetical protein